MKVTSIKNKCIATMLATVILVMQIPSIFALPNSHPLSLNQISSEANALINIALENGIVPDKESGQVTDLYLAGEIPIYEVDSSNDLVEINTIDGIMNKYMGGKNKSESIYFTQNVLYEEFDVTTKCKYGTLLMTMAQNNIKEGTDRGNPILARVTYNGIKEGHFVIV